MRRFLPALTLLLPLGAHAQTSTDITRADLKKRIEIIADDSMLGRDAGQVGNVRATNYIARELRRLGVEPAGTDGYFQQIPLMVRAPMPASLTMDGNAIAAEAMLSLRALGGAPFGGTFDRANTPTIFGGRIGQTLVDPALVRDRIVVFAAATNDAGQVTGAFAGNGVLRPYANAAAVFIAGLNRAAPQTVAGLRTGRILMVDAAVAAREVPALFISDALAEALFGGPLTSLQPGAAGRSVSGRFGMSDQPTPHPARNVIGVIRGSDPRRRGQYVGIGSHSDHVGVGAPVDHDSVRAFNVVMRPLGANDPVRRPTEEQAARIQSIRDSLRAIRPPRLDSIFNGADDDASGTAVALEVAEYFAKNPPKRSLLFVFHTAEEKGLYGATYFTDHPTIALDSIASMINMDQLSRGGPDDVAGSVANTVYMIGARRNSNEMGDIYEQVLKEPGQKIRFDYVYDAPGHPLNAYCRADHYPYGRYGVPAATVFAGWHRDYHMVTDEPQYASPETMYNIANFVRALTQHVGNLDHRPAFTGTKPDPRAPCRS
jgi:hypothetical protein